jgi:hypothetical protein
LASPAKKLTLGDPLKDKVGVSVKLYESAFRVELRVVLMPIVPVIPAIFTLIELAPAVNVCADVNVGNNVGIKEEPVDVLLVEYQKFKPLAVPYALLWLSTIVTYINGGKPRYIRLYPTVVGKVDKVEL